MTSYYAYDNGLPCQNPNCKSHGKPHPNCRCYSEYAAGGKVSNFCAGMKPHQRGCEYYAEGGAVSAPAPQKTQDDPGVTLGHAAVHYGLLGLLKEVGHAKLSEPDRHIPVLEDAKTQHAARKENTGEEFKKTLGNRIGHHAVDEDHAQMAERLHGHPMMGGAGKANLEPILERLAPEMMEKESHPEALRGAVDYLHGAIRGDSRLKGAIKTLIGKKGEEIEPEKDMREKIKAHLDEIQEDPAMLIEAGGNLGHYLSDHGSGLGAMAAAAVDYLSSLKPKQVQSNPLDEPSPPDKMAQAKYHRALDIAAQPLTVVQQIKDGTLVPSDIVTLKTLYPGLHQSMVSQIGERMIEARAKNEEIPYRQKQALSLFLGQPLDATQTPQAMRAIIASAAPQQAQKQAEKQKQESAATLKQVSKVDDLYALPTERRQISRKS